MTLKRAVKLVSRSRMRKRGVGPGIRQGVARDRIVSHSVPRGVMAANRRRVASTVTNWT
jgi:hypothetical protein